jgi:HlyD family secretion protein
MEAAATITLVATVNAVRRSAVGSEIAGVVAEMPVRQGDRVNAGDVLCRLDDSTLRHRLEEAQARFGSLKARHDELLNGTRPEEIQRLRALLEEAEAEHERWKFEAERIEGLYSGQTSNQKELTDARLLYLGAENRRIAARANYEMAVNGPRKETILQAAFNVAEQQAVVDRIGADLRKTTIRSPFAGHVTQRFMEVGEWMPEGGTVVHMIDLSTVLVRVDAPESAMPYLAEGVSARVRVDALKKSLQGRVLHVVRQADERARTFPVEIELDNRDELLASGMFARATLPAGPSSSVVAVPKDAVIETDGLPHVAIVLPASQGPFHGMLTPVTVGAEINDWLAITAGDVRAGTQVIVRGNERMMRFPTPIEIVDERGNPVALAGDKPKGGS